MINYNRITTLLILCVSAALRETSTAAEKPNIIVIMVDDMGFSDIAPYGGEIPTPNLDALAAGGIKFSQFHNTGRCCPTRASLLTGLYSHQAGIGWMTNDQGVDGYRGKLAENCATIAEVLRPAGYFTAMTGKWHVGFDENVNPPKRGFDSSLNLAMGGVHFPCMAPEKTIAKYRGNYLKGWDQLREERYALQIEMGLIEKDWPLTPRPEKIPAWDSLGDKEKNRYDDMMAIYAAMIDEVDKNIGKFVAALRERKQPDNTLILFLSDNGGNAEAGIKGRYDGENPGDPHSNVFIGQCWAHLNNTPFRKYKHYNHEGGTASPLIAHWPAGIQPNPEWVETPAHLIDIMATCADLGGAQYPKTRKGNPIPPIEGQSLRPLFTEGGTLTKRALFFEHEGNAAVRQGNLKLVRQGRNGAWELYNLKSDRTEQKNLAASRPKKVATLNQLWTNWADTHQVRPYPKKK